MLTDIEIAQQAQMEPIVEIAKRCNITEDELELYGKYKAKVSFDAMERLQDKPNGKLVLVTAITPTPAGEGKSSNHRIAFPPRRPSFLKSPVPAIPITRELNIKGTTIILIMRINTSPKGFSCFATSGATAPTRTPAKRPMPIHPDKPIFFSIESPFYIPNLVKVI